MALQEEGQQDLPGDPMEEVLVRAEAERSVLVHQPRGQLVVFDANSCCNANVRLLNVKSRGGKCSINFSGYLAAVLLKLVWASVLVSTRRNLSQREGGCRTIRTTLQTDDVQYTLSKKTLYKRQETEV